MHTHSYKVLVNTFLRRVEHALPPSLILKSDRSSCLQLFDKTHAPGDTPLSSVLEPWEGSGTGSLFVDILVGTSRNDGLSIQVSVQLYDHVRITSFTIQKTGKSEFSAQLMI